MGLSQYITIGKWIAIIGLIGTVLYQVQLLGKLKEQNKSLKGTISELTEANNELSAQYERSQKAARQLQRETETAGRKAASISAQLSAIRADSLGSDCFNQPVDADLRDRMLETYQEVFISD